MGGKKGELNAKQRLFVAEYMKDKNATQAAIRAKYSKKTAQRIGSENLSKPLIKAEIEKRTAKLEEKCELTAERVIKGLLRIADFDIGQIFDDEGRLLPISEMTDDVKRAIAGIDNEQLFAYEQGKKYHSGDMKKIKLSDRTPAWIALGKHLKMFTDVVEHKGLENFADLLREAKEREAIAKRKKGK